MAMRNEAPYIRFIITMKASCGAVTVTFIGRLLVATRPFRPQHLINIQLKLVWWHLVWADVRATSGHIPGQCFIRE